MDPASQGASEHPAEKSTYWDRFKEWLLPSTSFARSETPQKDLLYGRILIAIFYAILTGVFVYTVVRLCYSGRIELFSNLYKVDFIEAPSLAFCPFNANETIQWPQGREPWVSATKMELKGAQNLSASMRNCSFDRNCGCVDMHAYRLWDISSETASPAGDHHSMVSRESIEIRTNMSDPSQEHVLKVGIYDSFDKAPDWFYVNQGSMFIGQLELIVWTVVDVSVTGLINTFKGDIRAMVKNRHIFRYTSQTVGEIRHHESSTLASSYPQARPETSVRYEMKTFFVEETMSSHRAFSLYTVAVILALVALRWVVVDAFYLAMMPEWKETSHEPTTRELTPTAVWIRNLCCCCFGDSEPHERDPLLDKSAQA